jgi:hypothetical protein
VRFRPGKHVRSLLAGAVLLTAPVVAHEARACGVFWTKRVVDDDAPYLSVERVLIAWDETTGTEDFVREARFERSNQSFGFVVPVPSRPEVSAVARSPFNGLTGAFPYMLPPSPLTRAGGGLGAIGGGGGSPSEPAPAPVILSEQRVGSFILGQVPVEHPLSFVRRAILLHTLARRRPTSPRATGQ